MQSDLQQSENRGDGRKTRVSIGIIAWNEEAIIASTILSVLRQSLFRHLGECGWRCEIICVCNGCSDRTPEIAADIFEQQTRRHRYRDNFSARVVDLKERGKVNAWNQFVHSLSSGEARFLFLMDADIHIHLPDTLWNLLAALRHDPEAVVAVDRPCKHLLFKKRKSLFEHLSLAASRITASSKAQLCGQLYCIRSAVARNIYLPKDLAACEDGFIKTLVHTDFLTRPQSPRRLCAPQGAAHTFEAYTSLPALIRNQKRQMIGQTIVHVLVDGYLKNQPLTERLRIGEKLAAKDRTDPAWLKRLIRDHLNRTRFWWRLYPGLLGLQFRRLRRFGALKWAACFPAAAGAACLAFVSSYLARRTLAAGCTDYWPRARRVGYAAEESLPAERDGSRPNPLSARPAPTPAHRRAGTTGGGWGFLRRCRRAFACTNFPDRGAQGD